MSISARPNVVFIMADQWAAASLGCYGCDVPGVSPHLDNLARQGIRFARHYANAPVCGPSRATIWTGRSPRIHGVVNNECELGHDLPLLPQALRAHGYRTLGVGKFHFAPLEHFPPRDFDALDNRGFDQALVTEDPKHGLWLDWIRAEHPDFYERALSVAWPFPYIDAYPPHGDNLRPEWRRAYQRFRRPLEAPPRRPICPASPLPAALHQTRWIADRALEMLDSQASDERETPFFLFVSFVDPHDPYDPPEPWAPMFDPLDLPPPIPQQWTRAWCPREYAAFQDTMFDLPTFDARTWAQLRAQFYGSCRFVDAEIGRLLGRIRALGLEEKTLVVFTTDHGDMIGDHGLLMKGPWHFDKTIRCPLLLRGPNLQAGTVCQELSSTLDIFPTLCELCNLAPPLLEGRALPLDNRGPDDARDVFIESKGGYVGGHCQTLLSPENWRLSLFPSQDYGELFDLTHDPDEQQNLFRAPDQAARRHEMTGRLNAAVV